MADDAQVLQKILRLEAPWTVRGYHFAANGRRLDISVGIIAPRSWFGRFKQVQTEEAERIWRHVNFENCHVYIHAFLPQGSSLPNATWAAEDDGPFTRAMSRQVFALLREGASYEGICTLLGVAFNDIWKFKYALDSGQAKETPTESSDTLAEYFEPPAAGSNNVPDVTSPIWQNLLEGGLELDIRVLSLKLLLTRIRSQLDLVPDEEMKHLKMRELHRYFVKNQRMLGHELEQLRRATA